MWFHPSVTIAYSVDCMYKRTGDFLSWWMGIECHHGGWVSSAIMVDGY